MKKTEKETINDRVKIVRKVLNMTQQEFADKISLKTGNTFSMIEQGKCKITDRNINSICTPNLLKHGNTVNKDWLIDGKGEMFVTPAATDGRPKLLDDNGKELPPDEEELIGVYRELMPENKDLLRDDADKILQTQKNTEAHLRGKPANDVEKGERDRKPGAERKSG